LKTLICDSLDGDKTETTHELTYSVAREIEVITWQSVEDG